jgi:uracil-DNA glycosylase
MQQMPFYSSLDEVRAAASVCRGCRRAEQRTQVVFGAGDPQADLMLVAEYPSRTDDGTGTPYSGPAGDFLDEILLECGVGRDQIWITNIVRCYATESGQPGDRIRGASVRERAACRVWMDLEIQFVDPTVILAVGAPAASELIDPGFRLSEQRGTWHRRTDDRWVIATLQPAYLLRLHRHDPDRSAALREVLVDDVRQAAIRAGLAPA